MSISLLPTEIVLEISEYLPIADLCRLSLVSKNIKGRLDGVITARALETRKYYTTVEDGEALVRFSRDPQGLNLRLKKLILDTFIPYCHLVLNDDEIAGIGIEDTLSCRTDVAQFCYHKTNSHCHYYDMQRVTLLVEVLRNLPNIEVIELHWADAPGVEISRKVLESHFKPLKIPPHAFPAFYELYQRKATGETDFGEANRVFKYLMDAIAEVPLRKLKSLEFDFGGTSDQYRVIGMQWFYERSERFPEYKENLKSLREFRVRLFDSAGYTRTGYDSGMNEQIDRITSVSRFLNDVISQIETLAFSSLAHQLAFRWAAGDNVQRWPHGTEKRYMKYRSYFPGIVLEDPKLYLPNLKNLRLCKQVFINAELVSFLCSHQATLRHLTFKECIFQELAQEWSKVLKLLRQDLHLVSFQLDAVTGKYSESTQLDKPRAPYFRVYSTSPVGMYRCELATPSILEWVYSGSILGVEDTIKYVEMLEKMDFAR
ncbi:hypothetical protein H072_7545 [Dactylellina haptotyla CBS 200.50]|uniref:F-box domain-containing protein n=1 Tax=Dactylellina haptotyla (strain CBS 200.50) TaxID=1284197 RepID=S8ACC3_DACHA|nr:hypothetical protein H072_7545 [Dactylellina haptotyla CBS 200.50]